MPDISLHLLDILFVCFNHSAFTITRVWQCPISPPPPDGQLGGGARWISCRMLWSSWTIMSLVGVERSLTLLNQVRGDTPPTYVYVDKTRPWPSLTHCFTSAPCLRSTFRTAAFQAHPCLRRILCIFPDLLSPFRVPASKNSKTPHILVYCSIGSSHIIIDFRSYISETRIITLGSKSFRGIFYRCMLTSLCCSASTKPWVHLTVNISSVEIVYLCNFRPVVMFDQNC